MKYSICTCGITDLWFVFLFLFGLALTLVFAYYLIHLGFSLFLLVCRAHDLWLLLFAYTVLVSFSL